MRIPQSQRYISKNPEFKLVLKEPRLNKGQMTIVYESLKETPEESTLEQLVERCTRRGYQSLFTNPKTDIRKSILYQLNRMVVGTRHADKNIIRCLTPY
jgi:hypothetical protein